MPYLFRTSKLQTIIKFVTIFDGQQISQQWQCFICSLWHQVGYGLFHLARSDEFIIIFT